MRTAPAPNMLAMPGMNPGTLTSGGGGGAGGGSGGGGKGGKDGKGGEGEGGEEDAEGGGKEGKGGEGCGDPVCPITGKMFLEVLDFAFWATKELKFIRHYNSKRSNESGSFGFGWTHPFGWRLVERRRAIYVYDERGDRQKFARPAEGGAASAHPFGMTLARVGDGYRLWKPEGETLTFEKHPQSKRFLLRFLADVRGNTTTVEYDQHGRFCGLTDSEQRPFRATLDELGRIVRMQVPSERSHQQWMDLGHYRYDQAGDLVEYLDAAGFSWQYRYHNHLMVEHRTGCGLSYMYRYDGEHQDAYCEETWGEYVGRDDPALLVPISEVRQNPDPLAPRPKGINYVKLSYIKEQFYSEVENGLGGVTRYLGDSFGRVVQKAGPDGGVVERTFDAATGGVVDQNDGSGAGVLAVQGATGRPLGYIRPDGSGHLVHNQDEFVEIVERLPSGQQVTVQYNEFRDRVFVKHPDGTFEVTDYDTRGLVVSEVHRDGTRTTYGYDSMGNLVEVSSPSGTEIRKFDYLGRCVEIESGAGNTTCFRHDARSEVIYKRLHDGTELHAAYDANRKLTFLQLGQRVFQFEYGGLNWLVRRTEPDGQTTQLRYDVEGNLVMVQNARGQQHTLERDTLGRVVRTADFEGLLESRTYDSAGNVASRRTVRGIDTLEYDSGGRIVQAETPDNGIAVEYALEGGVSLVDNGSVQVFTRYDAMGFLASELQGNIESDVSFRGGWLYSISSDEGIPLTFERFAGMPIETRAGRTRICYRFPTEREKVTLLGEHLVRRDAFDVLGFLRWTTVSRRTALSGLGEAALGQQGNADQIYLIEYDYNAYGELACERRSDGRRVDYDLDSSGRIRSKQCSRDATLIGEEKLRYDAVGSPLLDGVLRDGFGRAVAVQNDKFEYDAAGRLARRVTDGGSWSYEWDATDNLRRVVTPRHTVEMKYDGRGRRMEKRVLVQGKETLLIHYVWENQILLREVNETSGWTRTYLRNYAEWAPFGHVDSCGEREEACYYFADRSGLPDFALDESGAMVWSAERTVFGEVWPDVGSQVDVRVRFAGQLYDEHVELVYNRMRWYEPRAAQYVLPDRLGLDGGLNFRDYVVNPTTFIDPMGEAMAKPRPATGPDGKPYPTQGNHPSGWGGRPEEPTTAAGMDSKYMTEPGHWATEGTDGLPGSIPCTAKELKAAGHGGGKNNFSADTTKAIDKAGFKYGCHTCGSKNPLGPDAPQDQTTLDKMAEKGKTHFVPDHIPPAALHTPRGKNQSNKIDVPEGGVRLFPQCRVCSNRQKNDVNSVKAELRSQGTTDDEKVAAVNAKARADFERNKQVKPPSPPPTSAKRKTAR